tara:strand:- start:26128 stop:26466 length:339 start_codon:yes stop_codon:yes gene_type:complete
MKKILNKINDYLKLNYCGVYDKPAFIFNLSFAIFTGAICSLMLSYWICVILGYFNILTRAGAFGLISANKSIAIIYFTVALLIAGYTLADSCRGCDRFYLQRKLRAFKMEAK